MLKDNKRNKTYSKELIEIMVSKLMSPDNVSISELSAQSGIPKSTLYGWKRRALQKNDPKNKKLNRKAMTSINKFHIVLETYTLSEHDLGKYCRENGLYIGEVKKWRKDLESSLDKEPIAVKEIKEELLVEKRKTKELTKELNRKDKALAEAAALMVLQKKFQALMEEEDN